MAKDFVRKNSVRNSGSFSKQLLLVLVCFLLGYLSASIADLPTLISWAKTQLIAQYKVPAATKSTPTQAQLPKPKFEFYTLLANESKETASDAIAARNKIASIAAPKPMANKNNSPVAAATTTAPAAITKAPVVAAKPVSPSSKDAYLVQVAAFKSRQEAERMKAALSLKGFSVYITVINQQKTNWFRVSLGPYATRPEAQKAQGDIARSQHIVGMIRKMDA